MQLGRIIQFNRLYSSYYRSHGVRSAEIAAALWRKSSWSSYNGNCVEVARLQDGRIAVRDTKDRSIGPALIFTQPEWDAFLSGAKDGEFD
jgi:Domain of unknown function (DUF397)